LTNSDQVTLRCFKIEDKIQSPNNFVIPKLSEFKLNQILDLDRNDQHLIIVTLVSGKYIYLVYDLEDANPTLKHGPITFKAKIKVQSLAINKSGKLFAFVDEDEIGIVKTETGQVVKISYNTLDANKIIWAINEPRLFTVSNNDSLAIFICTEKDLSIRLFEQKSISLGSQVIGFSIPYVYLLNEFDNRVFVKNTLNEFEGMSLETAQFMIDALTTKDINLHKALKSMSQQNETNSKVWRNLAQIAVKCRDINTGLYCVSKLRKARIVKDIKQQLAVDPDVNQALAILAMNLNLYLEAEEILKESKNWSALSKFYQSRNEWTKAMCCIDKMNSKSVYYNYAKHLEQEEDNIDQAIVYYEKSGTHFCEVPRMLFDVKDNRNLKSYCLSSDREDNEEAKVQLISWWGQYCESIGETAEALAAYQKAKDSYNLIRFLCYTGEVEKAKSIMADPNLEQTSNRDAALLHLGRHHESINPSESITYYLSCGAVNHAIRVCRIQNLVNDLAKIVINYGSLKEAKKFLEDYDQDSEKVETLDDTLLIELYHKCKQLDAALNLCLKSRLWSEARNILQKEIHSMDDNQQINIDISNDTLNYALDLLKSNSEIIDIVIDILLIKKGDKSMIKDLILESNIEINNNLLEKVERVMKKEPNSQLIILLAETALKQCQYFIAARLYNSTGDRVNSIKALIRTGATDRIINYANIARDKTVFKIAANYLQTINYADEKLITTFYKKAEAKQELNRFMKKDSN